MSDWMIRLADWFEAQANESEYLSHKENWTPRLTKVAREFLLVGALLGTGLGIYLGWLVWGVTK